MVCACGCVRTFVLSELWKLAPTAGLYFYEHCKRKGAQGNPKKGEASGFHPPNLATVCSVFTAINPIFSRPMRNQALQNSFKGLPTLHLPESGCLGSVRLLLKKCHKNPTPIFNLCHLYSARHFGETLHWVARSFRVHYFTDTLALKNMCTEDVDA
jgi:hypothetical protein